jgi:hypothetical protein
VNFRPELARALLDGRKTVTRRLTSRNPRSPWWSERCGLSAGDSFAVCPGRGKRAVGRARVLSAVRVPLGRLDEREAAREGFASPQEFERAFTTINGGYDPHAVVWRIEFELLHHNGQEAWVGAADRARRPRTANRRDADGLFDAGTTGDPSSEASESAA